MKIAILDAKKCEKKLFKKSLKTQTKVYIAEHIDKLSSANLKKISDAEVLSVFVYSKLDAEALKKFKKLKLIATRSTGYDHIDLDYCAKKKITVCNVPYYGENTVAEHAFALILALARKLPDCMEQGIAGDWSSASLRGFDLKDKTLGVIGAGNIGKNAIKIGRGFGMKVLAYDIHLDTFLADALGYQYTDLKTLLSKSDIISLHAPLNPHTKHMINSRNIKYIKKGAYLINTSRGALIQTAALHKALNKNILAGAGLDVLEKENMIIKDEDKLTPSQKRSAIYRTNKKIIAMDKVIFTPHIAFNTSEAVDRITETTIENIKKFIKGDAENKVSTS